MRERDLIILKNILDTIVNDYIVYGLLARGYIKKDENLQLNDVYRIREDIEKIVEEVKQSKTPRLDIAIFPILTITDINSHN